jgi:hypothetical protein
MTHLLNKRINSFETLHENKYLLTNSILLKQEITNSLFRKDILVSTLNMTNYNNTIVITISGFTRTNKLLRYRKLISKNKKKKSIKKNHNELTNLFTNSFNNSIFKNNVLINYLNVNKQMHKHRLKHTFGKYKKFNSMLFSRNLNYFLDFLKIICLIEQKRVDTNVLLIILGQIFKNLIKNKHSKFLFFMKHMFNKVVKSKRNNIAGMKFILTGRFMGKPRSKTIKISKGSLELNTTNSGVVYKKTHVYTVYGAFGFKIWINYKK